MTTHPNPIGPGLATPLDGRPAVPITLGLRQPITACSFDHPTPSVPAASQSDGRSGFGFVLRLISHSIAALTRTGHSPSPPPLPPPRRRWRVRHPALIAAGVVVSMVVLMIGFGQATADSAPAPIFRFSWPLPPPHQLLRPFQPPATQYGPGHRGVDLTGSVGEPVLAAGDGLVLFAGPIGGCDLISIEHPGGLRTTYEPVDPLVHVGQEVTRQEIIGHLEAARTDCPQEVTAGSQLPPVFLYWGVHRDRVYLDPMRLIETGRIRLLPWGDGR